MRELVKTGTTPEQEINMTAGWVFLFPCHFIFSLVQNKIVRERRECEIETELFRFAPRKRVSHTVHDINYCRLKESIRLPPPSPTSVFHWPSLHLEIP